MSLPRVDTHGRDGKFHKKSERQLATLRYIFQSVYSDIVKTVLSYADFLEKACFGLMIDGIIITHENGDNGQGILVNEGGTLIMLDGEISGNTNPRGRGGGVAINPGGVFELVGGVILDNTATGGGGVYNEGVFEMTGGKISNNQATGESSNYNEGNGGGVYVGEAGSFTMSGDAVIDSNQCH
jgi:hypothetical protein